MLDVPEILRSEGLTRSGFVHGFASRRGGVSQGPFASLSFAHANEPREHIEENLRRLGRAVGFVPGTLFEVTQVHGARVVWRDGRAKDLELRREEADAIVVRGGAAGVRVADCAPVLVGNVETGAAAAIHAGWRGVVAGVVPAAIEALGSGRKVAAIGPCIEACCFEVGVEVAARIEEAAGSSVTTRAQEDRAFVDLRRAIRAQLATLGLDYGDVDDVMGCTMCNRAQFFSFRRDGERSGRHLAVIVSQA
jgi:YfiH family protein